MDCRIAALMHELKTDLAALYGHRLREVYLYGSYARGEQDQESDVDVIIVLDQVSRYGAEIEITGGLVSRLSLRHRVAISRVFVSEKSWAARETSFVDRAREEAVLV